MTLLATSDKPISNFVKDELPKNMSRRTVTLNLASTATLKVGTVLGQVTGTGSYRPAVQTAVDGSENFGGILVALPENEAEKEFTGSTDYEVVILNQDAMVSYEGLVVDASYDLDAEIDALKEQMEAVGIRVSENRPNGPLL